MSRRRKQDDGLIGDFFEFFFLIATKLPWWIDFILGVVVYVLLHWLSLKYPLDVTDSESILIAMFASFGQYAFPVFLIFGGVVSIWNSFRGKELLWSTASSNVTEALAKMSWSDFELLIGQWFREKGYEVVQAGGAHADGGIDIELRKEGQLYLVQCKHWRAWKVPVETVRDLYGVMTSRGAVGGFVVTSGNFTGPAQEFAEGRVIQLIDGDELAEILKLAKPGDNRVMGGSNTVTEKRCPLCNAKLVERVGKFGKFLGCTNYPNCKHMEEV